MPPMQAHKLHRMVALHREVEALDLRAEGEVQNRHHLYHTLSCNSFAEQEHFHLPLPLTSTTSSVVVESAIRKGEPRIMDNAKSDLRLLDLNRAAS